MLNFKTIETSKLNSTIINAIKCYIYKTKNGKVKKLGLSQSTYIKKMINEDNKTISYKQPRYFIHVISATI